MQYLIMAAIILAFFMGVAFGYGMAYVAKEEY